MAQVEYRQATRVYPGAAGPAVSSLDLQINDGEFMVLVGPSGCGKSTALRMLAGLEPVDEGSIQIGDKDVTNAQPKDRDIAMVFQNYALYPHMTVAENIGFHLKIKRRPKAEIRERVAQAAKLLDLEAYLDRKPAKLSGGQRQRVAMGRAIVREPRVFLMDEPLSNLDAKLRVATRTQIASLTRRLGVTTVYVTHDQVEAMTMGDRVAVLKDGVLQQCDTPRALFDHPMNVFVAGFIGSPSMNLFELPLIGERVDARCRNDDSGHSGSAGSADRRWQGHRRRAPRRHRAGGVAGGIRRGRRGGRGAGFGRLHLCVHVDRGRRTCRRSLSRREPAAPRRRRVAARQAWRVPPVRYGLGATAARCLTRRAARRRGRGHASATRLARLHVVPTLADLVRRHTDLSAEDLDWLHLLVGDWQLLADMSFADLILWAPLADGTGFLAIAQVRPVTAQTAFIDDKVGLVLVKGKRPLVDRAWREGRICRDGDPGWGSAVPVREETIPVVRDGQVLAVIARSTNLATARTPSRLELSYLQSAGDLAEMVANGRFPLLGGDGDSGNSPRVGDGFVRLDADGRVVYASPNAVSAYRRFGMVGDLVGEHLGELTASLVPTERPVDASLGTVVRGRAPREAEAEANSAVIRLRAIPLRPHGTHIGALVLLREMTELRRRDRELVTKDATIREMHHRVKNNLQTVAALLRLQSRRIASAEGRAALDEAVRRVSSIAVVHETLSQTLDGDVEFDEIADRVLAMAGEMSVGSSPVRPLRTGTFGEIPAAVATALAMVLSELAHNAVEHGLRGVTGHLEVTVRRQPGELEIVVADDGVGLPAGFSLEASSGLGLQIVRTLVEGELGGTLRVGAEPSAAGQRAGGTEVAVAVSLRG